MVIPGQWHQRRVTISVKPNCLTISLDEPQDSDVFSYDLHGRLWTAFIDGVSYRRGLDGKLIAKWRGPADSERQRRWLGGEEAFQVQEVARARIAALYTAIDDGEVRLARPLPDAGHTAFQRAIMFDRHASRVDAERYHEVYKPVGILPPDQYMAVVLQMTEGCSFNTCSYCTFYRDRPFRIKPPDEFKAHAQAVKNFLAGGLSLRRTIFLGDANSMVVPMPRLLPLLDAVHEVYDVAALGGMFAFLDGFSGEKKSAADYAALHAKGLQRVYIGLESGHAPLLDFLHKPGQPQDAVQAVTALKAGGVAVGIIIMLGAGGQTYAPGHVQDTIDVLNTMPLDMDDIIYFSELVVSEGMAYAQDAIQAGLAPLTRDETIAQQMQIEAGLRFPNRRGTPHISRYDIREFVY